MDHLKLFRWGLRARRVYVVVDSTKSAVRHAKKAVDYATEVVEAREPGPVEEVCTFLINLEDYID